MGSDREMGRLFSIITLCLLLAGCSGSRKEEGALRICSLSAAATAVLTRLGTPPHAVDLYGALTAAPSTPVVGKGSAVSLEKLLALKIDTVIAWSYQKNTLEHLERHGIKVVTFDTVRMRNFPQMVRKLGALTGKTQAAEELIKGFSSIAPGTPKEGQEVKRVYFELYSRNRGAGDDSYIGDLLRAAGGKSVLKKTSLTGTETLIEKDPQVIFFVEEFGSIQEIMSRSGFAALEAVKHKAVYPVPRRLLVEGAFPAEAVEYLKKALFLIKAGKKR